MREFIIKNFSVLFIGILILFLWSKGIFNPPQSDSKPTIVFTSDTSNKDNKAIVVTVPGQTQYIPYPVEKITTQLIQDTDWVKQIIADYMSKRIQQDSIVFKDSLGYVKTTDTITSNRITGRKWDYNIKEKIITNTITIKEAYKPHTQLFYGFEITSPFSEVLGIQQAQAGLILKNKKDNILKATFGYNFMTNSPVATIGYYPKISFKK